MNKYLLLLLLFFASWAVSAQDGKAIYMKYCQTKGVEAAYISQEMFDMFGRLPKIEVLDEDLDLSPIVRKLTGLYMLESKHARVSDRIRTDVEAWVRRVGFSLIMRDRDDDEETEIYALFDGDKVSSLLFFAREDRSEVEFILIEGDILKEDLNRLLIHSKK